MKSVPKSIFKARALEYFREVEATGDPIIITDRGRPVLRLLPFIEESSEDILLSLRGSVLRYDQPLDPVGDEDWEALE